MATLEQRYNYMRFGLGVFGAFLFFILIGQANLFPMVLNYSDNTITRDWNIFVLTCTIFLLFIGLLICVRTILKTFTELVF